MCFLGYSDCFRINIVCGFYHFTFKAGQRVISIKTQLAAYNSPESQFSGSLSLLHWFSAEIQQFCTPAITVVCAFILVFSNINFFVSPNRANRAQRPLDRTKVKFYLQFFTRQQTTALIYYIFVS